MYAISITLIELTLKQLNYIFYCLLEKHIYLFLFQMQTVAQKGEDESPVLKNETGTITGYFPIQIFFSL